MVRNLSPGIVCLLAALAQAGGPAAAADCTLPPCGEAQRKALFFLADAHPAMRTFARTGDFDPAYQFSCYPAKTGAAMVEALLLAAGENARRRDEWIARARKVADRLIALAPKKGEPLAGWVPTYRFYPESAKRNPGAVCQRNEGLTMTRYPIDCAIAWLHLYRATGEERYLGAAVLAADTYAALQGEDGSWPLKVRLADAAPVAEWGRLIPGERLEFFNDIYAETGDAKYLAVRDRAFAFLERGPMKTMDWKGQFEDTKDLFKPFENLSKHDVSGVVPYLLRHFAKDPGRVAEARRLLEWTERNFVLWEPPRPGTARHPAKFGDWTFPCVVEQDDCYFPIDASAARLIRMYLAFYRLEGKAEDLEKAKRLGDSIRRMQRKNGSVQTFWSWPYADESGMEDWYDCILDDAVALGELQDAVESREPRVTRGDTGVERLQPIDSAAWIAHPSNGVAFARFRREFTAGVDEPLVIDVSADERYVLLLDGEPVGRGPDRGDVEHWTYRTYRFAPKPGRHRLEAVVTSLGSAAPAAQLSYRGGSFALRADGGYHLQLTTGAADWQVGAVPGTKVADGYSASGCCVETVGRGFLEAEPATWTRPVVVRGALRGDTTMAGRQDGWQLYPTELPEQTRQLASPGRFVAVEKLEAQAFSRGQPVVYSPASAEDARLSGLDGVLKGRSLAVPAHTAFSAVWDFGDYMTPYLVLRTRGGKGARVAIRLAEAARDDRREKGDRNIVVGKSFGSFRGDTLVSDGGEGSLQVPWWRAGRYAEIRVSTAEEPLELVSLALEDSHYPVGSLGSFSTADDPTLDGVLAISRRAVEMCAHEMLMDCPFYEQMMYGGDARLQMLILLVLGGAEPLVRRCIDFYAFAQRDDGMVPMVYPSRGAKESASYALCWALMFGDYARWHRNEAWLRARLGSLAHLMETLDASRNADGLLENLPGWNFIDWVAEPKEWYRGDAPDGRLGKGANAPNNLFYSLALKGVIDVSRALGRYTESRAYEDRKLALDAAIRKAFWDEARGAVADTRAHDTFSEHAQCLAILADALPADEAKRAARTLVDDPDLSRTTVYFSHYLFEAYLKCGFGDRILKKLDLWRDFVKTGLKTPLESPSPTLNARSDCHAWGSHPIYNLITGVAGIRPGSPFFRTVRVTPAPGGLTNLKASCAHPDGVVKVDLRFADGAASGIVETPVPGSFSYGGKSVPLIRGRNEIGPAAEAGTSASAARVSARPPVEARRFRSEAVERVLAETAAKIADPKLAWMFSNAFPNTLDTTVTYTRLPDGEDDTYVITGDIDAMWLRDSAAQVWPFLSLAKEDEPLRRLLRGVVRRQLRSVLIDPWANAFTKDGELSAEHLRDRTPMKPGVFERKYELDSLCYVLRLATGYWEATGDDSVARSPLFADALATIVRTMRIEQRKDGWQSSPYRFYRIGALPLDSCLNGGAVNPSRCTGLVASSFLPSDDGTLLPFFIPANLMAVDVLRRTERMMAALGLALPVEAKGLADEIAAAIARDGVVEHPTYGRIYAQQVDGFGGRVLGDDANVPNLLGAAYIAPLGCDPAVAANTRRFALSADNPYFFRAKDGRFEGIGGSHTGANRIWPMSIVMRALTSDDRAEIDRCLEMLRDSDAETGFMHEAFDVDNPNAYSRPWFAWANTLFGELMLKVAGARTDDPRAVMRPAPGR